MKRILIVVLALCLGACASHPQKADTAEQVVVKSNSTAGDIFKVFQDPKYRNRIAIFHYWMLG